MAAGTKTRKKGKAGAKASANGKANKRQAAAKRDAELTTKVVEMRQKDKKWSEIGKALSITPGKAQFLAMVAAVKPKDRIKGTDAEVAKSIVAARDKDKQSWGQIAARAGIAEGRVKKIYEETSGKSASGSNVASLRASSNGSTKATKKGSAKKASGAKGKKTRKKGKATRNPSR